MQKIMFSDKYGLTQAVLQGRKTQTRRIDVLTEAELASFQTLYYNQTLDFLQGDDLIEAYFVNNPKKIPYKVGEIVAIAQSYRNAGFNPNALVPTVSGYKIAAYTHKGWNNKMFVSAFLMPHQIRITNVRIERLQDISDEDCLKEGIEFDGKAQSFYCRINILTNSKIWLGKTPREAYAALIDKISGKGTWEKNPYVWVYDFEILNL